MDRVRLSGGYPTATEYPHSLGVPSAKMVSKTEVGRVFDLRDHIFRLYHLLNSVRGHQPAYGAEIDGLKRFPVCRKTLEPLS